MLKPQPVLIVSSNPSQRKHLADFTRRCKLQPVLAPSLADARSLLTEAHPLVVFCSDELEDSSMRQAIQTLRSESKVPIIALSRRDEWAHYLEACSAGAFDYIACPLEPRESRRVVGQALHQFRRERHGPHAA